ncbi:MAG: replication protein DnaC [Thermoanaerobacter sp.]|jgi:DNA replication protein DnaC|nr:replication protein DnaC [Thermoanaerobacter sp.]
MSRRNRAKGAGSKVEEYFKYILLQIEQNEKEARKQLFEKERKKIEEILKRSGLGRRFLKRTFDNFIEHSQTAKVAKVKAMRFVEDFPNTKGLILIGPVGAGKTHLAAAIANALVQKFYTVIFKNAADIVSLAKEAYQQNKSVLEIIDTLTSPDLLIIDDLGKEKFSEYASSLLYQIINRIYEDEKLIVITTNYSSQQLVELLGDRGEAIVSRLTEICEPIVMNLPDWRVMYGKFGGVNKETDGKKDRG